jgi:hypothetical protein
LGKTKGFIEPKALRRAKLYEVEDFKTSIPSTVITGQTEGLRVGLRNGCRVKPKVL